MSIRLSWIRMRSYLKNFQNAKSLLKPIPDEIYLVYLKNSSYIQPYKPFAT